MTAPKLEKFPGGLMVAPDNEGFLECD